ncbi:hypothetical protein KR222_011823, partial [Zaprionus bogoriensis]
NSRKRKIAINMHIIITSCSADNIFCYWDTKSTQRQSRSAFHTWNINTDFCTHLIYGSFVDLDSKGSGELNYTSDEFLQANGKSISISAAVRLLSNLELKSFLSIGDWNGDASVFASMMADIKQRDKFYTSLLHILYKCKFRGVQVYWKPEDTAAQTVDRENFATFLHELNIILKENKFQLIVAVSARLDALTLAAYDIPKIAKYADYISLISFDHPVAQGKCLAYNSPLYGDASNCVSRAVQHWSKHTQAPSKLLLGVPFFTQTYTLKPDTKPELGATSKGPGAMGPNSRLPGYMTYGEFCLQASKWKKQYDKRAQAPYAYTDKQWASFEDGRSISTKMHLVKSQHLGGVLAWSIDADDFAGDCGESYGLLRVIVTSIGNPDVLTTQAPTTEGHGMCPRDGMFRNPWDCRYYHECVDAKRTDYECIKGYYFDLKLLQCRPEQLVSCPQDFVTWRPGQQGYNYMNLPLNLKVVE